MADFFTNRQLLGAIHETGIKKATFFKDMFFKEVHTFTTDKVDLDSIPNKVRMAPYCIPMVGGKVQPARAYSTSSYLPGYVKDKRSVNAKMTIKRMPGEDYAEPLSPRERQAALVMQNMKDSDEAVTDREEMQCFQMIFHGQYLVQGEHVPEPYLVSASRRPENNIKLTGSNKLSAQDKATFDLPGKIEEWADRADGLVNIMILDKKAWRLYNQFKLFKECFETRRGSKSEAETALKDLGKVVSHKGHIGDVEIYVLDQEYIDEKGVTQKYMPDYSMILGHTEARGLLLYGAIQDLDAQEEGADEAPRYAKDWKEGKDPAVRYTMLQCAPGHFMAEANHFVVVELEAG